MNPIIDSIEVIEVVNKKTNTFQILSCMFVMILLIVNSRYAVAGAKEGIKLCLYTIIPVLFPYCVFAIMFKSMIADYEPKWMCRFEKFLNFPHGTGSIFFLGLLGGYPVGAICVEQAINEGRLSKNSGKYLRATCNNAGPPFIIGILGSVFNNKVLAPMLIVIQAVSAILTNQLITPKSNINYQIMKNEKISITVAIKRAVGSMANVCSIIILFRVILSIANIYFSTIIPYELWTVIVGIIELSNGIFYLSAIQNERIIFIIGSCMLSFGGLCVALQSLSLSSPKDGKYYIITKLIQTIISAILAYVYMIRWTSFIALIIILTVLIKHANIRLNTKTKNGIIIKNSRNSKKNAV